MTAQQQDTTTTIKVWLRMSPRGEITCETVAADESTDRLDVDALTVQGAQDEMTGYLVRQGCTPRGPWVTTNATLPEGETEGAVVDECVRTFIKSGESKP